MYKITNEIFGQIKIGNKVLKYKQSIEVKELNDEMIQLIENKIVKSQIIEKQKKIVEKPKKKKRGRKKKENNEQNNEQNKLIEEEEI